MDDLRSEIRSAFEKEQAAHPPAAALRHDVVTAVTEHPRTGPNLQWLAVAAAIVLGFAVVAGLMSSRLAAHRTQVPGSTPQASPIGQYGPPPAGVPVLYLHDPENPSWLNGYDWSGNVLGTLKLDPSETAVGMAPDGQSFALGLGAKGGTGEMLDRLGKPVPGSGALPGSTLPIWADDNKHMCGVSFDQQAVTWTLVTVLPGQPVKAVGIIAHDKSLGQTSIGIASCSYRNDRAILIRTTVSSPSELWVIRLSTGKVLMHSAYATVLANLVGSRDGLLVAENSPQSVGQITPAAPWTVVRRVSDKSVVAKLDPSQGVLAFNSDNSLVLVTTTPWVGGLPTHLAVIDLQSGKSIWTYQGPDMFGGSLAQPGGRGFALVLRAVDATDLAGDVVIVHGDGTSFTFPGRRLATW
ncbi:MAG: hypothetical protein QOJ10_1418 [Chloroflexota bacterium]|jgi:hypothetical protein|nr:hypothetical protein [Chloroflexota bacterium]